MAAVKVLPVIVSVPSFAASSPCLNLPVYVPERSVCSCSSGLQRPVRGFLAGIVAAIAPVSVAASAEVLAFGFERCFGFGFDALGAMVIDELEFCADTISPALVNAAKTPITTTRTKG